MVTFFAGEVVIEPLWCLTFPPEISARARGAELYGFGMGIPYVMLFSAPAFLVLFPVINWVVLKRLRGPLRECISGAIAYSAISWLAVLSFITDPPLLEPELSWRATFVFAPGFALFMMASGMLGGLVTSLLSGRSVDATDIR
jgi:hypothetical protein